MRIAFVAPAGAGKTTLARMLEKRFGFKRLAFATKVKELAQSAIFWRHLDKDRDRSFLQAIGSGGRAVAKDIWVRWLEWEFLELVDRGVEHFVVEDCRFLNEAQWLRDNGFVLIRLSGRKKDLTAEQREHISETELRLIECDYEIDCSKPLKDCYRELVALCLRLMRGEKEKGFMYAFSLPKT